MRRVVAVKLHKLPAGNDQKRHTPAPGKSGAMGVYAMGIRSLGLGVVAKTMDGSHDEFAATVLRIFELLGYENDTVRELRSLYPDTIINDNQETVGYRKAVFTFNRQQ